MACRQNHEKGHADGFIVTAWLTWLSHDLMKQTCSTISRTTSTTHPSKYMCFILHQSERRMPKTRGVGRWYVVRPRGALLHKPVLVPKIALLEFVAVTRPGVIIIHVQHPPRRFLRHRMQVSNTVCIHCRRAFRRSEMRFATQHPIHSYPRS